MAHYGSETTELLLNITVPNIPGDAGESESVTSRIPVLDLRELVLIIGRCKLRLLSVATTFIISPHFSIHHCSGLFLRLLVVKISGVWTFHYMWYPEGRICEVGSTHRL